MLLPVKSKNPPESLPVATILLIAVNVVVYVFTSDHLAFIRVSVLKNWGLSLHNFGPVHLITSMFLHADPMHIIGNMWFLYLFGFAVEGRLRSLKFVLLYLVAGIAGDMLDMALMGAAHPEGMSIGASGAIMGVMGAAVYMFPHGEIEGYYYLSWAWWGDFEWPMWAIALVYVGLDVLEQLVFRGSDGIGHLAHIGGAAGGFLVCLLLRAPRDDYLASDAKARLFETNDLRLLTKRELSRLATADPGNTAVLINWMYKCLEDPGGVDPECRDAFLRAFPQIMKDQEIGPIAHCVWGLSRTPGVVHPRVLMETAARLEQSGEHLTAMKMYEMVVKDRFATEGDQETAIFRGAMIVETVFHNHASAIAAYDEIIRRWPMSPFADQARLRLANLKNRAGAP